MSKIDLSKIPKDITGIAVDGSCLGNPGEGRFKIVDLKTKQCIHLSDPFQSTNNVAEFLALVMGIYIAFKRGYDNVYTDSKTAVSWLRLGDVNTSLPRTKKTEATYSKLAKAANIISKLEYVQTEDSIYMKYKNQRVYIRKWDTRNWGENIADLGYKNAPKNKK